MATKSSSEPQAPSDPGSDPASGDTRSPSFTDEELWGAFTEAIAALAAAVPTVVAPSVESLAAPQYRTAPRASFWEGMARIFDLPDVLGIYSRPRSPAEAVYRAWRAGWEPIGRELQKEMRASATERSIGYRIAHE